MHQKRTITARMLWMALIMPFMFVSFFATPATLAHVSANGAVILKVHRPVYKDSAKHAVSGIVTIDHPEGVAALCVDLQPGETTTLNLPFSLKLNDNIKVDWYTDNQCKPHTSSPKPYTSQSYDNDHSPYTINFP